MNLDQMRQVRAQAIAKGWTPERTKAKQTANGPAKVYLDDTIDSWGWPFGVSAKEFRQTLSEVTADEIELHINSPGGDAFEGVAMMNALRQHDARIVVMIDGLAASAASLVAMAADEIVMGLGTQLMIHDAWGLAVGNAEVMADTAARLSKLSDGYAEVYAQRTGRPVDEMRTLMRDEAWLNATEAIEQGFADRIDDSHDGTADNAKAKALTISGNFTAGEAFAWLDASASSPQTPSAEPVATQDPTPTLEVPVADAPDTEVDAGSDNESPPTIVINNPPPTAPPAGPDLHAEIRRQSEEIATLRAESAARAKAEFFDTACAQGRVSPAERAELEGMYDAAPEQTSAFVLARAVGSMVPVAAVGHEGDGEPTMREYEALYGKEG